MKTNIGIPDKARKEVAGLLARHLGDEYVLITKTRNAHWNVVGRDFHAMHLFFESQYKQIQEFIDQIAERIRSLGHAAPGSMAELLKLAKLKELPGATGESLGFINALLADQESMVRSLRESVDRADELEDVGTSDFLTGLMEDHEQMAWMLRAAAS